MPPRTASTAFTWKRSVSEIHTSAIISSKFLTICCISGKSGCRRIVPGQYLAIDPKGRAVMIGAVEKQKLVYILNRDSNVS